MQPIIRRLAVTADDVVWLHDVLLFEVAGHGCTQLLAGQCVYSSVHTGLPQHSCNILPCSALLHLSGLAVDYCGATLLLVSHLSHI
jgi:hypothetical protein